MKTIIKNEHAQAGVGTLIIFIAMVLVAAVAAAVLIQTSGVMQSKSSTTTKEAASAISENILIEAIDGVTSSTSLTALNITVKIAAGGSDIDLSKLLLKVKSTNFNYSTTGNGSNVFRIYTIRDPENGTGSVINDWTSSANPTLKAGALARIDVNVSGLSELTSRKPITISLTPEKGSTYSLPLTLPSISTVKTDLAIYP
ncbi:MAG: hypothetical protein Q7J35_19060 [Candidatus Methanoperedens sp.]|nr:hypothetical protein [Candidatus Methanoperedens sp.]